MQTVYLGQFKLISGSMIAFCREQDAIEWVSEDPEYRYYSPIELR